MMEIDLDKLDIDNNNKEEIAKLLKKQNPAISDDLEQMWYLMDLVWDQYGCNNKKLDWEKVAQFYSDPVWILNGLFIEHHELSMRHRNYISDWIVDNGFRKVIDYGGGFGTLARLIAEKDRHITVDVFEPHPSEYSLKRIKSYTNINFIDKIIDVYDCLISTDVLEHVNDPLEIFYIMIKNVKRGGYLIIANNFFPVIKCHLPHTFHFRYTFNMFAKLMGLEVVGLLQGSHATIFKKINDIKPNWATIRFYEMLSKLIFPLIEISKRVLKPIKRLLRI
ncbi:methyltransferase domain-containing protein [Spirochaetia bacterium 38H-sp]|uniref:Methyltransferase domain-containing protein n=1 Tax=Rarispira pelagica TaxID=3141764 RepID=A0ABU9U9W8_9SPIR